MRLAVLRLWVSVLALTVAGALLPGCASGPRAESDSWPRPGAWSHRLELHESAPEGGRVRAGRVADRGSGRGSVHASEDEHWLELDAERGGVYESPVVPGRMTFVELVPSWNIELEGDASALIEMRVRAATDAGTRAVGRVGAWSPWLRLGRVGETMADEPEAVRKWDFGKVSVDVIQAEVGLDAAQYRVRAMGAGEVRLARFGMALTDNRASLSWAEDGATFEARATELGVPFRSQRTERPEIAGRICSPTSVTMVLASHGVDRPVGEVAAMALDPDFDIYGNWPRNVQTAYELGVGGYVERFSSWGPVQDHLDAGRALVVSIKVGPGELPGAPYDKTNGHLIVLRGFDANGDCFVNDPAVEEAELGELVYSREALEKVWMGRAAGTAYVLGVD